MQNNLQPQDKEYNRNMTLALVLIVLFMGGWYYFYETPHIRAAQEQRQKALAAEVLKARELQALQDKNAPQAVAPAKPLTPQPRETIIAGSDRIKISTGTLHGSINLTGARIDDISLSKYKETLDKNSKDVPFLAPAGTEAPEFIETGWISADKSILAPSADTKWQVEGNSTLTPTTPVTLTWDNGLGVKFITKISIDENYMFAIDQSIQNNTSSAASFFPYALISKTEPKTVKAALGAMRAGPLGVMDGTLKYVSYDNLRETPRKEFPNSTGWIGITDKYWAAALIPAQNETYTANYRYFTDNDNEKFQVDYLGKAHVAAPNGTATYSAKFFAGAKELKVLDAYGSKYNLRMFERLIDFGWWYFLSEPMMKLLIIFYSHIGNAGLAILALTFCVKLCLFPLARKSYISMGRIRDLTPKITQLREQYKNDKMELNKQTMQLYKKEKVNPASGCLPVLLQMPIFFALYKVFYVSIEMRHAPFFGWIHDLSEKDPTSIFNLFGLIPLDLPTSLMIGALPCIWACTMYVQQQLQPPIADPTQAKVIKGLPLMLVFLFAKMPAGLVVYWIFSNTMTIFQQLYFIKYHGQRIDPVIPAISIND